MFSFFTADTKTLNELNAEVMKKNEHSFGMWLELSTLLWHCGFGRKRAEHNLFHSSPADRPAVPVQSSVATSYVLYVGRYTYYVPIL